MASKDYKSIKEIRRDNLRLCVAQVGDQTSFLATYGHLYDEGRPMSNSHLNQLLSGKASFGDSVAEKIEAMLSKPKYWFDTDHSKKQVFKNGMTWPFPISYEDYLSLNKDSKELICNLMEDVFKRQMKSKKTGTNE